MASPQSSSAEVIAHIKYIYHAYRHTEDTDRRGLFFSPSCLQICRPTPTFTATTRNEIVQYLKDAQQGKVPVEDPAPVSSNGPDKSKLEEKKPVSKKQGKGQAFYTIRPLKSSEFEFSNNDITAPIGLTANELKRKAEEEKWIGMRVDLWDEGGNGGLLVKVQYWWRFEEILDGERSDGEEDGYGWRQCLHDIMYLGPKDGTEGKEGLEILE